MSESTRRATGRVTGAASVDCSSSSRVFSLLLAGQYVTDARFRRRPTVVPLDCRNAFEFPERLELLEIGCDDPHLEVAALVCKLPQVLAHILSVDRPSRPVEDAHSVEELILVDHHAPGR